jgi:predicted methyltransferase
MHTKAMRKSVATIHAKADVCSILAKSQRDNADMQHENARRLEMLAAALEASSVELKADLNK